MWRDWEGEGGMTSVFAHLLYSALSLSPSRQTHAQGRMHTFLDSDSGRSLIRASTPCHIPCATSDFLITQLAQRRAGKPHGLRHRHPLESWRALASSSSKAFPCQSPRYLLDGSEEQCEAAPPLRPLGLPGRNRCGNGRQLSPVRLMQIRHQWEPSAFRLLITHKPPRP